MKHRKDCKAPDWFRVQKPMGRAYGRTYSAPIERCVCGVERAVGGDLVAGRRSLLSAKHDAKREALMIARANRQSKHGKTAAQRASARLLVGEP